MDTLHDQLAELASQAPTGGAPPAELWARGRRAHRLRAAAVAATMLVVGAVGTGLGFGLLGDGDGSGVGDKGSQLVPAGTLGIALPLEYPTEEELPDLGATPGRLAAVWVAPPVGGGAPDVVGLVAETGEFGTLPIDIHVWSDPDPLTPQTTYGDVELSPDGRRIAYLSPTQQLTVHDLVSGQEYASAFDFGIRGYSWVDVDHLLGRVAEGHDGNGWLWQPGTGPDLVNFYSVPYAGTDLTQPIAGSGPQPYGDESQCSPPTLQDLQAVRESPGDDWAGAFEVPMLCDVLGITGSEILLGHWNSDLLPGDWNDPDDGNGTVVALDIQGLEIACPSAPRCELSYDDRARRHVIATASSPLQASFAADLIAEVLRADAGPS